MYKLLVVDAEPLTGQYIQQSISLLDIKWEVTGEASNGKEALNFLAENSVDLVITDIKMPVMDGLQLCYEIRQKYPHQKVIIFSEYRDFSFAQQAIRYGVSDYLLKPPVKEELQAALLRIREQLDCDRLINRSYKAMASLSEKYEENIVVKVKNFIYSNYSDPISLPQVAEYAGVSSNYLSNIFHKSVGEPYIKFLTRVRMEQAAKLLNQKPSLKIMDISRKVGYISVKHFLYVFKQYFNTTPGKYRNNRS